MTATSADTILVVDDHVNLAKAFAFVLHRAGYRVHTANAAEEGLRLARCERPSAIVLDLRMPFINGAGFLYRLRDCPEHRDTPVLVVTGGAVDEQMRSELADLRAVVRFKPLGMTQLLAEVDALVKVTERSALPVPARPAAEAKGH